VLVARINELLQRVGGALQAQKRFVADAAHQLRTPLAAVMLHAERAERASDPIAEHAALSALRSSVRRAARLSQQLLILARAEPNTAAMEEFRKLDLVNLARQVGEEWIPISLEQNVDFGLVVPDHPVWIHGNERLLVELLSNLIDNALRYIHRRNGPDGVVTVTVEDGACPILAVDDNGPGVPEQERHRIFERFYRLPGSIGEGCGLGLAIVEEIAHLHKGTVTVTDANSGTGSRFVVSFPPIT
jgi:two-component system sensor histidine kinase TctE